MLPVEEKKPIPETRRIGIGEHLLPTATPIGRLIKARSLPGATRRSQNVEGIPGPNAAKIQPGCAGRRSALLPQVASILATQDCPIGAAGPDHAPAHRMDSSQAGCGFAVLELPRTTVPGGLGPPHQDRQYTNG